MRRSAQPDQIASNPPWSSGSSQQAETRPSTSSYRPTVDQRRSRSPILAKPSVRAATRAPSPEDVASLHAERATGEVTSSCEVSEHFLEPAVGPRDAIVAGNGPGDAGSQQLFQLGAGASRVVLVLGRVKPVQKIDGDVPVH